MKDTQAKDATSLKQTFSSWPDSSAHVFGTVHTDAEPFSKAPAPSDFHTPEILSRFAPDPLLAITPEKTLGKAQAEQNFRARGEGDADRKGRQRVRFAPGTRTSPPSKNAGTGTENKGSVVSDGQGSLNDAAKSGADEESVPRSFSVISQKLYQPGRYADHDEGKDAKIPSSITSKSFSDSPTPKRYTVEMKGGKTVYIPMDIASKNITSEYSSLNQDKPVTAKIVRHKPASASNDDADEACSTEVKEAFQSSSNAASPTHTPVHSRSTSPSHSRRSPLRSRKTSPSRYGPSPSSSPTRFCSSPSRSSGRLTPVEGSEFLTPELDEKPDPVVRVIREAPYQPKYSDYVFPFEDMEGGRGTYDSSLENPLARPEFNSALKIGQELKSVKGKRPDTWGAVSQKLKNSDRKRTQIQEKASSKVNFQMQSGLYSDLVDVDVPLDDLCENVEKGIRLRAPSPKPSAAKVPVGKEPDLMEFFSPDLLKESPDLTLTGIQPITASLTTANPMLAFDLYRHNRAWNGLTDS